MVVFEDSKFSRGRLYQVFAVFTCTISAISDGMQYGWTSPVIPLLKADNSPIKITSTDVLWLENIYMIGGIAGLAFTIYSVNKFGRRNSVLIAAAQNLLGWILIATATNVETLYVARFLSGLAADVAFVSAPMYVGEISDKNIRGFMGSCIYLMMLTGILLVYSVVPYVSLFTSSSLGAFFLIVQLLTFPFMPKSPYYLVLNKKYSCARKALEKLRSGDVEDEYREIILSVEQEEANKGSFTDLFKYACNRKPLLIVIFLSFAQHFAGISVILMNVHVILSDVTLISANSAAIVFSAVMLLAAITSANLVDRLGRKSLLVFSSISTGCCLLVLGTYFAVRDSGVDVTSYNWILLVSIMVYAAVFKYGLGMIPIVLTGELFPPRFKAIGMTIGDCTYVVFSVASISVYQVLDNLCGPFVPFFIFSLCCFATVAFTILYIPETKHKSLEEIQCMLENSKNNNYGSAKTAKFELLSSESEYFVVNDN